MQAAEDDAAYLGWLGQAKIEAQNDPSYFEAEAKALAEPPPKKNRGDLDRQGNS